MIVNLIKAFHNLGAENSVITPNIGNDLATFISHYTSHIFVSGGSVNPFNSIEYILTKRGHITEIVNREKPDAIIIQPGWLSLLSNFMPKDVPILVVVHGTYLNEAKYMWFHPIKGIERLRYTAGILASQTIELLQLKPASARRNLLVVSVSKNTKKELMNMGIQHNRIISILNGVDKDVFKPVDKDYAKALIEETFKVGLRDKLLLHMNPGPRKGTHTLIKAIAVLRKIYGDNFILLITGRLGPKTYKEYVEGMVKSLKLKENVKIVGYIEDRLLPLLYNAADVTVVPSYSEGSPLVLLESLGCNTPVVATNVGGNPEYLTLAGLEELIVPLSNYDFSFELTLKIIKALDNIRPSQFAVPSWLDISKIYFRVLRDLMNSPS